MKFNLEIKMINAAFEDEPMSELARILRTVANKLEYDGGAEGSTIRDVNGNTVGEFAFTGGR